MGLATIDAVQEEAARALAEMARDEVPLSGNGGRDKHTNGHGLIHGGLIATLANIAMGYSCGYQLGAPQMVTIGLAVDYIGGAQVGQWLAVEPEVIKIGSTICFAQCFVKADDVVIARANATFRVVRLTAQTPASGGRP
jgi:uncharacterized protein (TIGR00369 family)